MDNSVAGPVEVLKPGVVSTFGSAIFRYVGKLPLMREVSMGVLGPQGDERGAQRVLLTESGQVAALLNGCRPEEARFILFTGPLDIRPHLELGLDVAPFAHKSSAWSRPFNLDFGVSLEERVASDTLVVGLGSDPLLPSPHLPEKMAEVVDFAVARGASSPTHAFLPTANWSPGSDWTPSKSAGRFTPHCLALGSSLETRPERSPRSYAAAGQKELSPSSIPAPFTPENPPVVDPMMGTFWLSEATEWVDSPTGNPTLLPSAQELAQLRQIAEQNRSFIHEARGNRALLQAAYALFKKRDLIEDLVELEAANPGVVPGRMRDTLRVACGGGVLESEADAQPTDRLHEKHLIGWSRYNTLTDQPVPSSFAVTDSAVPGRDTRLIRTYPLDAPLPEVHHSVTWRKKPRHAAQITFLGVAPVEDLHEAATIGVSTRVILECHNPEAAGNVAHAALQLAAQDPNRQVKVRFATEIPPEAEDEVRALEVHRVAYPGGLVVLRPGDPEPAPALEAKPEALALEAAPEPSTPELEAAPEAPALEAAREALALEAAPEAPAPATDDWPSTVATAPAIAPLNATLPPVAGQIAAGRARRQERARGRKP